MARFVKNKAYFDRKGWTAARVEREVDAGLSVLESVDCRIVTFFGSHVVAEKDLLYSQAHDLAKRLGEQGFAVCTGGGPGIMKAANSGAMAAGAPSIGFKEALLQHEQGVESKHFTHQYAFEFMFVRRFVLAIKSEALIFFPGGFGTLNELFEYVVLMQTGMVDTVPVICVGKEFWKGLDDWIEGEVAKRGYVQKAQTRIYTIVDDVEDVLKKIK